MRSIAVVVLAMLLVGCASRAMNTSPVHALDVRMLKPAGSHLRTDVSNVLVYEGESGYLVRRIEVHGDDYPMVTEEVIRQAVEFASRPYVSVISSSFILGEQPAYDEGGSKSYREYIKGITIRYNIGFLNIMW